MSKSCVSLMLIDPGFQWAAGHANVSAVVAQVARCMVHYIFLGARYSVFMQLTFTVWTVFFVVVMGFHHAFNSLTLEAL